MWSFMLRKNATNILKPVSTISGTQVSNTSHTVLTTVISVSPIFGTLCIMASHKDVIIVAISCVITGTASINTLHISIMPRPIDFITTGIKTDMVITTLIILFSAFGPINDKVINPAANDITPTPAANMDTPNAATANDNIIINGDTVPRIKAERPITANTPAKARRPFPISPRLNDPSCSRAGANNFNAIAMAVMYAIDNNMFLMSNFISDNIFIDPAKTIMVKLNAVAAAKTPIVSKQERVIKAADNTPSNAAIVIMLFFAPSISLAVSIMVFVIVMRMPIAINDTANFTGSNSDNVTKEAANIVINTVRATIPPFAF